MNMEIEKRSLSGRFDLQAFNLQSWRTNMAELRERKAMWWPFMPPPPCYQRKTWFMFNCGRAYASHSTYPLHSSLPREMCSEMAIRSHQSPPHSRCTQCKDQALLFQPTEYLEKKFSWQGRCRSCSLKSQEKSVRHCLADGWYLFTATADYCRFCFQG